MDQPFESKFGNEPDLKFQPYQIVCLEHDNTYLYAEVVQMADGKQVCWVRPVALVEGTLEWMQDPTLIHPSNLHDLRHSSDLLLPSALFRSALDTEVIPLLSYLSELTDAAVSWAEFPQAQLNQLVKKVCLAHPELF